MQDDIKRRASDAVNHLHEALNVLGCKAQELGLQTVIACSFLLWSIVVVARTIGTRRRREILLLPLVVLPTLVLLGSCAAEVPEARYRLPVQPLIILACCLLFAEAAALARRRHATT